MEDFSKPYMSIESEYKQRIQKENRDLLFALLIVAVVIGSLIATIWMAHENAVLATMLRLSETNYR